MYVFVCSLHSMSHIMSFLDACLSFTLILLTTPENVFIQSFCVFQVYLCVVTMATVTVSGCVIHWCELEMFFLFFLTTIQLNLH